MAKFIPRAIPEPTWETQKSVCNQFDLVRAFQWYNDNKTDKDARKYLVDYLVKTNKITTLQKQAADYLNSNWNIVDGWFARIISRGAKVPEKNLAGFEERMQVFKSRLDAIIVERGMNAPATTEPTNVISIQERVQNKVDYYIMEIEAKFDEVWHRGQGEFFPYTWMVENEVKPMHASKIAEYFRERAKNWVKTIDQRKTDEYVKESYPRSQKEMVAAAQFFVLVAADAEKLASNKNAARKPRKKKPVSFEKKVKSLKYKTEDTENKLVSINPVKIIGAEKLWIYNVKTRKLGVYVTADAAGLDVKGSSIVNYKYSESISKTLRKPKDVLSRVLDGGKVVLRKVMNEVNAKPQELNGRINKDTILLRVE